MRRECWRLTEREEKKSSLWKFQISREQGDSQLGQRLIIHYICHLIAFHDPLILHWFSVPSFGNLASLRIFYCSVSLKLFFPIFVQHPSYDYFARAPCWGKKRAWQGCLEASDIMGSTQCCIQEDHVKGMKAGATNAAVFCVGMVKTTYVSHL